MPDIIPIPRDGGHLLEIVRKLVGVEALSPEQTFVRDKQSAHRTSVTRSVAAGIVNLRARYSPDITKCLDEVEAYINSVPDERFSDRVFQPYDLNGTPLTPIPLNGAKIKESALKTLGRIRTTDEKLLVGDEGRATLSEIVALTWRGLNDRLEKIKGFEKPVEYWAKADPNDKHTSFTPEQSEYEANAQEYGEDDPSKKYKKHDPIETNGRELINNLCNIEHEYGGTFITCLNGTADSTIATISGVDPGVKIIAFADEMLGTIGDYLKSKIEELDPVSQLAIILDWDNAADEEAGPAQTFQQSIQTEDPSILFNMLKNTFGYGIADKQIEERIAFLHLLEPQHLGISKNEIKKIKAGDAETARKFVKDFKKGDIEKAQELIAGYRKTPVAVEPIDEEALQEAIDKALIDKPDAMMHTVDLDLNTLAFAAKHEPVSVFLKLCELASPEVLAEAMIKTDNMINSNPLMWAAIFQRAPGAFNRVQGVCQQTLLPKDLKAVLMLRRDTGDYLHRVANGPNALNLAAVYQTAPGVFNNLLELYSNTLSPKDFKSAVMHLIAGDNSLMLAAASQLSSELPSIFVSSFGLWAENPDKISNQLRDISYAHYLDVVPAAPMLSYINSPEMQIVAKLSWKLYETSNESPLNTEADKTAKAKIETAIKKALTPDLENSDYHDRLSTLVLEAKSAVENLQGQSWSAYAWSFWTWEHNPLKESVNLVLKGAGPSAPAEEVRPSI